MRHPALVSLIALAACAAATGSPAPATAQGRDFNQVQIVPTPLRGGLTMLTGSGGNIGVSVGADGVLVIDDQFAPLAPKIHAAIAALSDKPVRILVNTHFHGDHTGGNVAMREAGAILVAQENVRKRLSADQFMAAFNDTIKAAPAAAWPVLTFADSLTFHWNGQTIRVLHVKPAHTDGDAILHFVEADVVHMGDTFFNGIYPLIDVSNGGSIEGMIAANDRVLALAGPATQIIPGHGPLGDAKSLKAFRDMLATARDRIAPLVAAGKSQQEVVAAKPLAALDAQWGKGFLNGDTFTSIVYADLKAHAAK